MSLDKIIEAITSIDLPAGSLSGGGVILMLLAMKFAKGLFKLVFILLALGLIAGGIWWYLQHRR